MTYKVKIQELNQTATLTYTGSTLKGPEWALQILYNELPRLKERGPRNATEEWPPFSQSADLFYNPEALLAFIQEVFPGAEAYDFSEPFPDSNGGVH